MQGIKGKAEVVAVRRSQRKGNFLIHNEWLVFFVIWNDEPTRKVMSCPDVFPRNVHSSYVPFLLHKLKLIVLSFLALTKL